MVQYAYTRDKARTPSAGASLWYEHWHCTSTYRTYVLEYSYCIRTRVPCLVKGGITGGSETREGCGTVKVSNGELWFDSSHDTVQYNYCTACDLELGLPARKHSCFCPPLKTSQKNFERSEYPFIRLRPLKTILKGEGGGGVRLVAGDGRPLNLAERRQCHPTHETRSRPAPS